MLPPRDRQGCFATRAAAGLPDSEVTTPRYAPDPHSQVEHYLELLDPARPAVTGTLLELDAEPGIEGLITLS